MLVFKVIVTNRQVWWLGDSTQQFIYTKLSPIPWTICKILLEGFIMKYYCVHFTYSPVHSNLVFKILFSLTWLQSSWVTGISQKFECPSLLSQPVPSCCPAGPGAHWPFPLGCSFISSYTHYPPTTLGAAGKIWGSCIYRKLAWNRACRDLCLQEPHWCSRLNAASGWENTELWLARIITRWWICRSSLYNVILWVIFPPMEQWWTELS